MQFGIQLKTDHTSGYRLNGVEIAFSPLPENGLVSEAIINEETLELIDSALKKIPHKLKEMSVVSKGFKSYYGADW